MLDLINRYCHGFVTFPVIHSLQNHGFFKVFDNEQSIAFESFLDRFQANSGHLKAALRLLESLEILTFDQGYQPGTRYFWLERIPESIDSMLDLDFTADFQQTLDYGLTQSLLHWSTDDQMLADFLDGLWLLPLLLQARKSSTESNDLSEIFKFVSEQDKLEQCFQAKGWLTRQQGRSFLSTAGQHLYERIFIAGTVYSYRPMLLEMSELIFGDTSKVFQRDDAGHENHLDRLLNVQASGFQHERYFKDCEAIITDIFNQLPIKNQPDFIADMGCGDGTLLKRVYQLIQTKTTRGEQLQQYPLVLIGADYNQKALLATAATLATLPHKTIQADIGNPGQFVRGLESAGINDPDKILHIRSFLDHDRPYQEPENLTELEQRVEARSHGVYIDDCGQFIPVKEAYQSLVEHLRRWSEIIGSSGAMFLEVHSMAPKVIARHLDQCENLHFDAYHAFSGQMLTDADEFLFAAAESGLFPRLNFSRHYPKTLAFSRITLNWFEKRRYRLRQALTQDLAALNTLDQACWPEHLRAGQSIISERLKRYPHGQYVIEQEGIVIGVLYTQRINDQADLDHADFYQLPALHDPHGPIIQILGMNILPDYQHFGLGDQLLDFLLYVCRLSGDCTTVLGVSRCKQFSEQTELSMDQYLQQCRDSGVWDTVLNFHVHHGAEIVKPIQSFWPEDVDNQGFGILVRYQLTDTEINQSDTNNTDLLADDSTRDKLIDQAILSILGEPRKHLFSTHKALMETGLDSLDLLELRTLLNRRLGVNLEPMFFFSYPTATAIKDYFKGERVESGISLDQSVLPSIDPIELDSAKLLNKQFEVAIIGMGCRFPGAINSPESFWQYLKSGQHSIGKIPTERWDYTLYETDGANSFGGFLDNVDQFDAEFFNLTPREARLIDPQHRLLLETAWEAFEQAGIAPNQSSQTGVFVGISAHDYELLANERNQRKDFDVYHAIGNSSAMAAGRLAYFFGFNGPAISIDTACSSSLMAVHQACESLRQSDCGLALAGGVNLMLAPDLTVAYSKSSMLAADGCCKTFDADADGYVRSEGCGMVLLKPLAHAVRDRDQIFAVIKGSAINQDGASNGITAPNSLAQQALITQALARANTKASDISMLEAHGTGTPLGDPVEIESAAAVYSQGRSATNPLLISSVKTNIGHTESAAGVAGLMKLSLSLQHQFVPPHLHFKQLNPRIPLAQIPARIPVEGMVWQNKTELPRTAALSSFGFSGTNVHMIVSEGLEISQSNSPDLPCILALSAQTLEALQSLVRRYIQQLSLDQHQNLLNIAASAAIGRQHFTHRIAIAAGNTQQLVETLNSYQSVDCSASIDYPAQTQMIFLFTGQGSQYLGMAGQLYRSHCYFRQIFKQCSDLFETYIDHALTDLFYSNKIAEHALQQTELTQPALFSLEYALAKQWQHWGIEPEVLIGHSIGEYAAACIAGILSLDQAVMLVARRGQLMQAQPCNGKMVAVNCSQQLLEPHLTDNDTVIACFNAPERLVVSGTASAVDALIEQLTKSGISCIELNVSHAFHSSLMQNVLPEFRQTLEQVQFKKSAKRIISTVSGQDVTDQMSGIEYWLEQIVQPVNFSAAITSLLEQPDIARIYLEIGPRTVLTGLTKQIIKQQQKTVFLPALDPGMDDNLRVAENIGRLYELGAEINWQAFYGQFPFTKVSLPTYPFQRQRYWLDDVYHASAGLRKETDHHPLLGQLVPSPLAKQFQADLSLNQFAWLKGHVVNHSVIFPLSGYLEMAMATAGSGYEIKDIVISKPCYLQQQGLTLQTVVQDHKTTVYSHNEDGWQEHFCAVIGNLHSVDFQTSSSRLNLVALKSQLTAYSIDQFYSEKKQCGYQFSGDFCSLKQIYQSQDQVLVNANYRDVTSDFHIHPVLLDAALQSVLALIPLDVAADSFIPFSMGRFALWGKVEAELWSHARLVKRHQHTVLVDISIYDQDGLAIASVESLLLKRVTDQAIKIRPDIEGFLHSIVWQPKDFSVGSHGFFSELQNDFDQESLFQPIKGCGGRLNQLAITYLCQGLQESGLDGKTTYPDLESFMQSLCIEQRFKRLFNRVLVILEDAGIVRQTESGWEIDASPDQSGNLLAEQLLREYPELESEVTLIARCGDNLKAIWQGQIDPLQFIFPANNPDAISDFYRHSQSFSALNQLLADTVAGLTAGTSKARPCRILEIGAGTGSATSKILSQVKQTHCRYHFTDVSGYFIQQAKREFSDYDFIDYHSLDISSDPVAQGFELQSYDIIIASNVVHATSDLKQSLRHCRQLLTDGGHLILLEGVQATPWIDAVFGLTEGWWLFNDSLRTDYPLLTSQQWQSALSEQGMDVEMLVLENDDAPFKQALILAKAPVAISRTWLLMDDQQGVADQLIKVLSEQGVNCFRVTAGEHFQQLTATQFQINAHKAEHYQQLINSIEQNQRIETVINCWPLSLAVNHQLTANELMQRVHFYCNSSLLLIQTLLKDERANINLCQMTKTAQSIHQLDPNYCPEASVLWGMNKVAALEHPELNSKIVDLDNDPASITSFIQCLLNNALESQQAYRHGQLFVPRLTAMDEPVSHELNRVWRCNQEDSGSIRALQRNTQTKTVLKPDQVEIKVQHVGLNFIDVMDVLGLLPFKRDGLGMECVGVINSCGDDVHGFSNGQVVVALVEGAFADYVNVSAKLVAVLPATVSALAAATLPVGFITAGYALNDVAQIKPGQSILIHAAAGGTGMAAVQVALAAGAEVYATASKEKWSVVKKLGVKHVMNSRDLSFVDEMMQHTNGQGVDVVFNSLTGDFIPAGLSLLKAGGCFLEIGKRELLSTEQQSGLADDIKYCPVDVREFSQHHPEKIQQYLQDIIHSIEKGRYSTLPHTSFEWTEIQQAFRYMQQAKHTGKIVLTNRANYSEFICDAQASYLITGGLKGVGLYSAQWLVEKGAKHLFLLGRSEPTEANQARITALQDQGIDVVVLIADVNNSPEMEVVFNQVHQAGVPLKGIIHSVGVLSDSSLLQHHWSRYQSVLEPKIKGTWQLHQLSLNDQLDFFMMYSSVASLLGSAGQSNHAAANAFLDAFAAYRRSLGLPGQSINWCGWSDIGSAAELQLSDKIRKGLSDISPEQGAQVLDVALSRMDTQLAVTPMDWSEFLTDAPMQEFYQALIADSLETKTRASITPKQFSKDELLQAGDGERNRRLSQLLTTELAAVLGMETKQLKTLSQRHSGFFDLGLDSLTSVEFKNRINRSLDLNLSASVIFDYPTIQSLSEHIALALSQQVTIQADQDDHHLSNHDLEDLSLEETAELLVKELG